MSGSFYSPYPQVGVALWILSEKKEILLLSKKEEESGSLFWELPLVPLLGGESWVKSAQRLQTQVLGQDFPLILEGLSHATQTHQEAWSFILFKVELTQPIQLVSGIWKKSLEGLSLGSLTSQLIENIDTLNARH